VISYFVILLTILLLSSIAAVLLVQFDPDATALFTITQEPAFEVALYFAVLTCAHVGNGGVVPTNRAGRIVNTSLIVFALQLWICATCEIAASCIAMPQTPVAREKRLPVLVSLSTPLQRRITYLKAIIGLSCVMVTVSLAGASVAYVVAPEAFCEDEVCSFMNAWYWALNTLCRTGQREPSPGLVSSSGRIVAILYVLLFVPLYPLATGIICGKLIDEHQSRQLSGSRNNSKPARAQTQGSGTSATYAPIVKAGSRDSSHFGSAPTTPYALDEGDMQGGVGTL
jgi:hypothetical protein